jgi:hypothetical protein
MFDNKDSEQTRQRHHRGQQAYVPSSVAHLPSSDSNLPQHASLMRLLPGHVAHRNLTRHTEAIHQMQRTHGNRAVQRQTCEPANRAYQSRYTDGELVQIAQCHERERQAKLTVPELVQEHIAKTQSIKAFYEDQEAQKQALAVDDAQRAITGLPTDWAMWGEVDRPGRLDRPQYDNVSPALDHSELQERERQREYEEHFR